MFCRRRGHNEQDEPAYTHPLMYKTISNHPTVGQIYASKLVAQGVLTEEQVCQLREQVSSDVREAHDQCIRHKEGRQAWLANSWQGRAIELAITPGLAFKAAGLAVRPYTGVHPEVLRHIARVITTGQATFPSPPPLTVFHMLSTLSSMRFLFCLSLSLP